MERLSDVLVDLARVMFDAGTAQEVFDAVATCAARAVPGCDGAAIVLVIEDRASVPSASDDVARRVEQAEVDLDTGPCLQALRERALVRAPDLAHEDRWPEWSDVAIDAGFRSIVGFRLYAGARSFGALDLFSTHVDNFDDDAEAAGLALAGPAALALANTLHEVELNGQIEGLRNALASRDVIGQAKGILMHRERITAEQAFDRLRVVSQHTNRPLRDIAAEVAATGALPGGSRPPS